MSTKKALRWQDMDHSEQPLFDQVVGARSIHTTGPVAEFLAKKAAEQAPKTHEWYREALTQLAEFLDNQGITRVGEFTEHAVNLFRLHLRQRGAGARPCRARGLARGQGR